MTKKRVKNKLWWFISWLQVILLAIPLLDVAKNTVFNTKLYTEFIYEDATIQDASPLSESKYLMSDYTLLDYSCAQTYYYFCDDYFYNPNTDNEYYYHDFEYFVKHFVFDLNGQLTEDNVLSSYIHDSLYFQNFNITEFNFLFMLNNIDYNFTDIDGFDWRSTLFMFKYLFFNWYMNYILTILIVFFVPYLLVFIFSWFASFAESFVNKSTKEDD